MDPAELVKLCEILNPRNKPGRLTVIVRMGAEKLRQKLPALVRAVRQAGIIVTWVCDPMHGNTIKAPSGIKTRPFDSILVSVSARPFPTSIHNLIRCLVFSGSLMLYLLCLVYVYCWFLLNSHSMIRH